MIAIVACPLGKLYDVSVISAFVGLALCMISLIPISRRYPLPIARMNRRASFHCFL